jgi:hypothetical protein
MAALNFPSSPFLNQVFTANGKSWRYDGTSWKTFYVLGVPSGGTGNTSYNLGDILVGAGTSTITKVGPTATAGQVLQSAGSSANPVFSTATYPSTTTANRILYSSATNTVGQITNVVRSVMTCTSAGVPTWTALAADGQLIIGSASSQPTAANITSSDSSITVTNGANSISLTVASVPLDYTEHFLLGGM